MCVCRFLKIIYIYNNLISYVLSKTNFCFFFGPNFMFITHKQKTKMKHFFSLSTTIFGDFE